MPVLYVDIYFLINFTVDLISLFFAVRILHIRARAWRLILLSVFGGIFAVLYVIFGDSFIVIFSISAVFLSSVAALIGKGIGVARRIKALLLFIALEMVIGGLVYFVYNVLDNHFEELSRYVSSGDENRKALVLSLIILLIIGVIKIFIMIFSGSMREKSANIRIEISGKSLETDALVDSGNLVRDPISQNPIVFIKSKAAELVVPREIIELQGVDELDYKIKRRIRLVPVTRGGRTHVMTGFVPDSVSVVVKGRARAVEVTVVIDKEEGTFGGYDALMPSNIV